MEKRTTKPEYSPFILAVVKHMMKSTKEQVLDEVFNAMKHRLYPDDLVELPNGEPRWRNQAQHMLDGLIEDGHIQIVDGELRPAES